MGFRILPFGWLPDGFNMVGRLGPLHKAGQAVGPLNSGSNPKGHSTNNAPPPPPPPPFFLLKDYALLVGEKYCVSET